jgi:hypothetical protein
MKYVLEWCVRPGIGGQQAEADTQRAYDLYSKWQPKVTILQFVGRVDAEGGFMVCEADNPADILEGTAKLANYVQYKCHRGRYGRMRAGRSGRHTVPQQH